MAVYKVEVNGPQNDSLVFSPTRTKLRGRWDMSRVAHRDKHEAMRKLAFACPTIPGQAIEIDTDKGTARIYDLLAETNDNRKILSNANAVFSNYRSEFEGPKTPQSEQQYKLGPNEIKTWVYVIVQCVATNYMTVLPGSSPLPSEETIAAMPGKRRRDPLNTGNQTAKSSDENEKLYAWVDEVEVPAGNKTPAKA